MNKSCAAFALSVTGASEDRELSNHDEPNNEQTRFDSCGTPYHANENDIGKPTGVIEFRGRIWAWPID